MKKLLLSLIATFVASVSFAQTELLTNGSFEEWTDDYPTAWKSASTASTSATVAQSTDARTGTYAVEIKGIATSNKRLASKEITLKPGTYTFSIWMKSADQASVSKIGYTPVTDGTVGSYVYSKNEEDKEIELNLTSEYAQYSMTFTLEAKTTVCLVAMNHKKSNAVSIIADDASLTTTDGGIDESGDEPSTPEGAITVAEALAKTSGTATVSAAVYAISNNGFVIGDETGFMYVYKKGSDVAVADLISITDGPLSVYGGFTQFNNPTIEITGGTAISYPTPEELDGAALDAWFDAPAIKYVKVKGTLTISGNYYNLNVEGAEKAIGSLVSPVASVLASDVTNNSKVTVVGFAMYTSGSKYVNIVATSVTIDEAGETKDITNTPETAYTTSEAKDIVDEGLGLEQAVYVKGTVVGENLSIATDFGNANYYITDGSYQLYVYRGNYVENTKFTSEDQLKEGDEVIIYGKLQNYAKTDSETGVVTNIPEFTQGNYIYSLNGVTNSIVNVNVNANAKTIYDLSGRRVEKAVKGIYIVNGKKVIF